jgi:endonuclease/exonuclease/phosphatase family metal-dependent hydrolase
MITNTNFMNKKTHILITIIVTVITLIVCPVIYNQPFIEYNLYTGKKESVYKEQIKKDNLILCKKENEIRIMTLNLLAHYKSWGGRPVEERSDMFFSIRDGYSPDVLGLQEMCSDWYKEISNNKSNYKFVSPIKTSFPQKMTAILYNSDTLKVIDSGNEVFSDTLNYKARRVVWAVFKVKNTSKIFVVLNTHLSFLSKNKIDENYPTQACQVNKLYSITKTLYSQYSAPILVIGDFNTKRRVNYQKSVVTSGSYGILNSLYTDAENVAKNKFFSENMSFNNTLNDHIFIYGDVNVTNLSLLSQDCFVNLSDHFPILADISF